MKKVVKRKLVLEREVVKKLVLELPVDGLRAVIGGAAVSATNWDCGSWVEYTCRNG